MSRAFDFVVVGVIWSIAAVIHLIAIELFQPGSPLYGIAVTGTEAMSGQERADFWFEFLAVYMPALVAGGIIAWAFMREYKRQALTGGGVRPPRGPR